MAVSKWRPKPTKTVFICTNTFVYRSFESLITKKQSKFQISNWGIQNGGQNLQKRERRRLGLEF